jgi:hypothetical protein
MTLRFRRKPITSEDEEEAIVVVIEEEVEEEEDAVVDINPFAVEDEALLEEEGVEAVEGEVDTKVEKEIVDSAGGAVKTKMKTRKRSLARNV